MGIVSLASVVAIYGATELTVLLAVIVAAPVEVVELEAYARNLVDIACEVGTYTIFSALAVTAFVVGQVGDGT